MLKYQYCIKGDNIAPGQTLFKDLQYSLKKTTYFYGLLGTTQF